MNFSIQVRDYLDLVETRLSDLRVQGRDWRRGAAKKTRNDSRRGDRMDRLSGHNGDPTRREVTRMSLVGHVPPFSLLVFVHHRMDSNVSPSR